MLYYFEEKKGAVALIKADPKFFHVVSSFSVTRAANHTGRTLRLAMADCMYAIV